MSNVDAQERSGADRATVSGSKKWRWIVFVLLGASVVALAIFFGRPEKTQFEQAVELIKSGKSAFAVPILEKLSRERPDDPNIYPYLAQGYLTTDRPAEGRLALDTALRLRIAGRQLAPVVSAYASYYTTKGHFEEAEKLFNSAASVMSSHDGADERARLYLAWAEEDLRKTDLSAAVAHLKEANSHAEAVSEPLRSLIPHRLSDCYRQLAALAEVKEKDIKKAAELLETALKVSDEPVTRMSLALIYTQLGNIDGAIANYDHVSKADPNNLEARHRLISLLCDKNDFQAAQSALIELCDKERSVENYALLANIDLKLQNFPGAVRALEDALDLGDKPELLKQLEATLLDWSQRLAKEGKREESASIKVRAERVAEQLSLLIGKPDDKSDKANEDENSLASKPDEYFERVPPIALSSSRIWLARGSFTPEGEIRIRNISGRPVKDLALKVVFFDNSSKRASGSVNLPVATPDSPPLEKGGSRTLYFSCPSIVKAEHRLAVVIYWRGRLLKEYPVVKQ
jgi:tetratricopeptide (TPR) repeat protein